VNLFDSILNFPHLGEALGATALFVALLLLTGWLENKAAY